MSLNYSGPNASLRIFYYDYFNESDYLVSIDSISSAVDCYYFDKNCDYILEIGCYGISFPTTFSFHLESITISNLASHEKYALHQIFDSNSSIGFHYETLFFNVDTQSYLATTSYINSYSSSTSYADVLDNTHYFFDSTYDDNRQVVVDTGYDEYSSIAHATKRFDVYQTNTSSSVWKAGFSGTFISETAVLTCAHSMYSTLEKPSLGISTSSLNREITFKPGVNSYSSQDYYGKYTTHDLYLSVSFLLKKIDNSNEYGYVCADYDWCLCLTTKTTNGTRTHSYMGISGFSYDQNLMTEWSHARCAGYPSLFNDENATDLDLYEDAMWTSIPLENSVYITDNRIISNEIVVSAGNSGGPMYQKIVTIQYGIPVATVKLLGIVSGSSRACHTSAFYRNTALIVNIVDTVLSA